MCREGRGFELLTENGRYLASVRGPVSGNVLLRREQYRRADSADASAILARAFLSGKLANSRSILRRAVRDHADRLDSASLNSAADTLTESLAKMQGAVLENLRGIEGDASRRYFSVFDKLINARKRLFRLAGVSAVRPWIV